MECLREGGLGRGSRQRPPWGKKKKYCYGLFRGTPKFSGRPQGPPRFRSCVVSQKQGKKLEGLGGRRLWIIQSVLRKPEKKKKGKKRVLRSSLRGVTILFGVSLGQQEKTGGG